MPELGSSLTTFLVSSVQYWNLQCLSNAILAIKKVFMFWGHFTKMCCTKFPPFTMKASLKTACHKIQWVQFVNRNTVGLQSWHSSRHFQILVTPTILTLQLRVNTNYNFCLANTTICARGFSKCNYFSNMIRLVNLWNTKSNNLNA